MGGRSGESVMWVYMDRTDTVHTENRGLESSIIYLVEMNVKVGEI